MYFKEFKFFCIKERGGEHFMICGNDQIDMQIFIKGKPKNNFTSAKILRFNG